jgi:hypothetical protein
LLGPIKKIRSPGVISIAVSNWNFLCDKIITVGSAGEAMRKMKVLGLKRALKSNKNEEHKQNRLPVVVEKNINYESRNHLFNL